MVCGLGGLLRQPVLYKLTAPEMQTPGLPGASSPEWHSLVLLPIRFWTPDTLRPTSLPASGEVTITLTAPTEDPSLNTGDPPRSPHSLAVICIPARHIAQKKMASRPLDPKAPLKLQTDPRGAFFSPGTIFPGIHVTYNEEKILCFFKTSNTK